ncbi:hypothetical protein HMPREF9709_01785 [Helcococcus kunzii ATCC 51366]|uniref:3-keto-5-aminohexanoate cleavage enzyme n=1 Tax=Helcococcus kunzii ATCC 51366 TaxID=883114 RepID=H3NR24_9FIRM|nr:3-keto-5-aminohexanoate cleavage protein [Helcococcus kunzii]EHR31972.1 hypothetical protein HMPREF9709_01785 [Helcococcus kunzii ATCC 51366]
MLKKICLNGGLFPTQEVKVPITLKQYVKEIQFFINKGILNFHIHFRDSYGNESLDENIIYPQFRFLKDKFPMINIGIGSPLQNGINSKLREDLISNWYNFKPDFISVNLSEKGSIDLINILKEKDIKIEYGIFSLKDAEIFTNNKLYINCYRVLLEIIDDNNNPKTSAKAIKEANNLVNYFQQLYPDIEIILHGENKYDWDIIKIAIEKNINYRIGLEDTTIDNKGRILESNIELYNYYSFFINQ